MNNNYITLIKNDIKCELHLPPDVPHRNKKGQFTHALIPHNKGKRWVDYMDMRHARKILGCLRRTGNPNLPGANRKKIVGVKNGKCGVYDSSCDAERRLGIIARNIRKCCHKERNHAGGIRWFYFDSDEWIKYIDNSTKPDSSTKAQVNKHKHSRCGSAKPSSSPNIASIPRAP